MEDIASKFNINVTRDAFIAAEPAHAALVRKLLKPYYFLHPRDAAELGGVRAEMHFVIVAADLSAPAQAQLFTTTFTAAQSPLAHKVALVTGPDVLSREMLLYLQELGVRYTAMGDLRNDELKEYLKRVCVENHQVGPLEAYAADVERAVAANDRAALQRAVEKLKELPPGEDVLRLLAAAHQGLGEVRRSEIYLKKLLQLNPQNLWAANTLGKVYLRGGRVAEGVEILQRLSQFHELNSERLLVLGDAYVRAGEAAAATTAYRKGDQLSAGTDPRFKDGLAKVKIHERDFRGALTLLGSRGLSEDVISFLNLRAIIAIRAGQVDEGVSYYQCACDGAGVAPVTQAKLKFNMGLAYARSGDLEKARLCFVESATLGGVKFPRARRPLEVVKAALKNREKAARAPVGKETIADLGDAEWETLF